MIALKSATETVKGNNVQGFALIITLTLMAFILILLLSFSTIIQVENQGSDIQYSRLKAQQNSLLALQVALGELHVLTSPDQRVTATGDLFINSAKGTQNIVGVWNSNSADGSNYGKFLQWLISRRDINLKDDISMIYQDMPISHSENGYLSTNNNFVLLVGDGSVKPDSDRPARIEAVVAEKMPINTSNIFKENYAWWVGDEGVKTKVNTVDPRKSGWVDKTKTPWDGLDNQWAHLSQLASQGTNLATLDNFDDYSLREKDTALELTRVENLTDLLLVNPPQNPASNPRKDAIKRRFHSLTTTSYGLQTNVRDGGLKRDLSLLFELPETNYYQAILPVASADNLLYTDAPGPQSDLPLLFKAQASSLNKTIYGPTLDMLRDYYRLYKGMDKLNTSPTLKKEWAHCFFPGKAWFQRNGYGAETDAWGQMLGSLSWRTSAIEAPEANKTVRRTKYGYLPQLSGNWKVVRPTRGNYVPYLNRFTMFTSVEAHPTAPSGDEYDVNVLLQPVIALHNPYNMHLEVPEMRFLKNISQYELIVRRGPDPYATGSDPSADWDLNIPFRTGNVIQPPNDNTAGNIYQRQDYDGSKGWHSLTLGDRIFKVTGGGQSKAFNDGTNLELSCIIPAKDYAPGEVKIFAAGDRVNTRNANRELNMKELPEYQPSFGIDLKLDKIMPRVSDVSMWVDHDNDPLTIKQRLLEDVPLGTELLVALRSESWFKFALEIKNASGYYDTVSSFDSRSSHIGFYGNYKWDYRLSDLQNEAPKDYLEYTHFIEYLSNNPTPSVALDVFLKPMDYSESLYSNDLNFDGTKYLTSPQLRTFANYTISNPLAASFSRSAFAGRLEFNSLGNMFHISSEKVHRSYSNNLMDKLFTSNAGTWGRNNGDQGNLNAVILELPIAPMQSIGQFQHANLSPSQNTPLLSVGHSLPSPYIKSFSEIVNDFRENYFGDTREFVFYDHNYLVNESLWDTYYFSSISPRPTDPSYTASSPSSTSDPYPNDLPGVIDAFIRNDNGLPNSRIKFGTTSASESIIKDDLLDFSKSAGHLLVDGSFNINSTSKDAWATQLSTYRDTAILFLDDDNFKTENLVNSSAFLRHSIPSGKAVNTQNSTVSDDSSWRGFLKLSDEEINTLAERIVTQIKLRSVERGKQMGTSKPTPALSLSSFVNRMLTTNDEFNQSGNLQAAIDQSGINESLITNTTEFKAAEYRAVNLSDGSNSSNFSSFSDYPNQKFQANSAAISPVALTQANILQAMAPILSARSDTFKIRCYGDTVDPSGRINRAWCEAVVQRMVDHTAPRPESRRYVIIKFRWLSPDEV